LHHPKSCDSSSFCEVGQLTAFWFNNIFFQLAQKLREEHESASVVYIEDGNEEAGLRGDERELFEKFLKIENKQVRP